MADKPLTRPVGSTLKHPVAKLVGGSLLVDMIHGELSDCVKMQRL